LLSLSKLTSQTKRLDEIVRILARHGLTGFLEAADSDLLRNLLVRIGGGEVPDSPWQVRVRLALADLGTTFIKLGQMLSTRADVIGPELAGELAHLQASTPPDAPDLVRKMVEGELGGTLEELFESFDLTALASASIGQVHAATLIDGTEVVVKVQHAGIQGRIRADLDLLDQLAAIAARSSELRLYQPRGLAAQFRRELLKELDFEREARNLERFRRNFAHNPRVHVPTAYLQTSSKRVLTMERLTGIPLQKPEALKEAGLDLDDVARRGAQMFVEMVFEHGFYHADPHPGNIWAEADGTLALLDCGMASSLDEARVEAIEDLLLAIVQKDSEQVVDASLRIGEAPDNLDPEAFRRDVSEFVSEYGELALDELDLGSLLGDFTGIIRKHRIRLPTDMSLLIRMLTLLEGTSRQLSAGFSLVEIIEPHLQRAVKERFSPKRMLRRLGRAQRDWDRLLDTLPRDIGDLVARARKGTLDIHLEHRKLDTTINRLIYGVLTAALVLASAALFSGGVAPLVQGVSVLGALCATGAMGLGFRLLRAIEGSGGLTRRS
jgi:ubiquinone biosynthesis protein